MQDMAKELSILADCHTKYGDEMAMRFCPTTLERVVIRFLRCDIWQSVSEVSPRLRPLPLNQNFVREGHIARCR